MTRSELKVGYLVEGTKILRRVFARERKRRMRKHVQIGDRIEHDDYGPGTVVETKDPDDWLCFIVRFDRGPVDPMSIDVLEPQDWRYLSPLEQLAEAAEPDFIQTP